MVAWALSTFQVSVKDTTLFGTLQVGLCAAEQVCSSAAVFRPVISRIALFSASWLGQALSSHSSVTRDGSNAVPGPPHKLSQPPDVGLLLVPVVLPPRSGLQQARVKAPAWQ